MVAEYLITAKDCPLDCKGVVFFHSKYNEWQVLSKNLHCAPLGRSPILPDQAIVYFDESHCRGVDMKLKRDAKAIVTVGIKMMKDKLFQALGRMRQLGKDAQRATVVAFQDITRSIQDLRSLSDKEPTTLDLIHWVMHNTIQSNTDGLVQWASQGAYWCLTHGDPELSRLRDDLTLLKMYRDPMVEQVANTVAQKNIESLRKTCEAKSKDTTKLDTTMLDQIKARCQQYGSDCKVATSGYHEECERELQEEVEEEKEVEVGLAQQTPNNETDWVSAVVFSKKSITSIHETKCLRLDDACRQAQLPGSTEVPWEKTKIFCTTNFLLSLMKNYSGCAHPDYLRLVDGLLAFPSGEVLLLSERESDKILELSWDHDNKKGARFMNAADFQRAKFTDDSVLLSPHGIQLSLLTVVGLKLFAGQTDFTEAQRETLAEFLGRLSAAQSARELIRHRGFQHLILMSDFDIIFNRLGSVDHCEF